MTDPHPPLPPDQFLVSINTRGEPRWWLPGTVVPPYDRDPRPASEAEALLILQILAHDRAYRPACPQVAAALAAEMRRNSRQKRFPTAPSVGDTAPS